MAKVIRKPGPARKGFEMLVRGMHGVEGKVGWNETAKYPNGTPVAYVMAIQEFGATINVAEKQHEVFRQIDNKGNFKNGGRFVSKKRSNFSSVHKVGAHVIVIPPRSIMRSTAAKQRTAWAQMAQKVARGILAGNLTPTSAVELLCLQAEGDIAKTMATLSQPPLSPATIRARLAQRKSKKVGNLTKPLIFTAHALNTLGHDVGRA